MKHKILSFILILFQLFIFTAAKAEDGYDLWLRYKPLPSSLSASYNGINNVSAFGNSQTIINAKNEIQTALKGLLNRNLTSKNDLSTSSIIIGTPNNSEFIKSLKLDYKAIGNEGFIIKSIVRNNKRHIIISANTDIGVLYGSHRFIKLIQTGENINSLNIQDAPKIQIRVLNHWDNPNGYVERGYAGRSIFDWWTLPYHKKPRYYDYARSLASVGINGVVLNNVNSKPENLNAEYIEKTAALADIFRPYGVKVYLTARYSAPIELGGLKTSDPLDPEVKAWWKAKAKEIYTKIPDFGGFLIKANSEGQPGPQDYNRNHAEGANMLAEALKPYGGIIMWRAFVYSEVNPDDRAKQAYNNFAHLDGKFADNVIVQVKNGAIDFQPREPFHPLFGAMPKTNMMPEFQITKEYLGFSTHLAYLGQYYEETLQANTFAKSENASVADITSGKTFASKLTAIAGVSNIGDSRNWTGANLEQANLYAFGRLAWNPYENSRSIVKDWLKMTYTNDKEFVSEISEMMMRTRETVADYMTPLGLHHVMATGHHYGPGPWVSNLSRPEWNPVYYHKANKDGIGFDRTATGSNAISQYHLGAQALFNNPKTIDERYLLWFHHVSWDFKMKSGRSLWEEMVFKYTNGVAEVDNYQKIWAKYQNKIDKERFDEAYANFTMQKRDAKIWRDASLAYFMSINGRPLPKGYAPPEKSLEEYKAKELKFMPGDTIH